MAQAVDARVLRAAMGRYLEALAGLDVEVEWHRGGQASPLMIGLE